MTMTKPTTNGKRDRDKASDKPTAISPNPKDKKVPRLNEGTEEGSKKVDKSLKNGKSSDSESPGDDDEDNEDNDDDGSDPSDDGSKAESNNHNISSIDDEQKTKVNKNGKPGKINKKEENQSSEAIEEDKHSDNDDVMVEEDDDRIRHKGTGYEGQGKESETSGNGKVQNNQGEAKKATQAYKCVVDFTGGIKPTTKRW